MARGIKVGDYGFPFSIRDTKSKVKKGQSWELVGDVIHVDGGRVTVNIGVPVTVDAGTVKVTAPYVPPVDEPT